MNPPLKQKQGIGRGNGYRLAGIYFLTSVPLPHKVKRLFLAMAERHGHPWVSELDLLPVDLGRGKRMIVPGGCYDKKYQITVPIDSYEEAAG